MNGEINYNAIIVGLFNTPFSMINIPSRQKIAMKTLDLNYILEPVVLTDI
jgi:hypothetical protein